MARSNPRSGGPYDAAEAPEPAPLPGPRRRLFAVATGIGGFTFAWAALRLPWRPEAPLALLLWALAAAHVVALIALLGRSRRARHALWTLVVLSLTAAPVFAAAIVVTSVAMVRMFGALGWGLSVALAAIAWLLLLATLPLALAVLRQLRSRPVPDAPHADA